MFEPLAAATFFALLGLPGLACLYRLQRPLLGEGVLAAIGPSYLASFALLTPVSVAGYLWRWPIAVLAGAYLLAVLGGAIAFWPALRDARPVAQLKRPTWLALAVGALIALDLLLSARVGGYPLGDGHYHVGRVRSLLDHGFQSWDPRSAGRAFDVAYHTNLYHALLATAAKLTGMQAFEIWAHALPWAKLLSAAGAYRFALVVTGRPTAALVATACAVVWSLARTTYVYPNMLAPYALVPLALSFGLELGQRATRVRGALGLGLAALAIAQVHTLYYVFLVLALGPCLAIVIGALQRDLRGLALLLVLAAGAPWALKSSSHRGSKERAVATAVAAADVEEEAGQAPPSTAEGAADGATAGDDDEEPERMSERVKRSFERRKLVRNRGFVAAGDDLVMLDPAGLLNPTGGRAQLLLALVVGFWLTRRRELLMVAGIAATLLLALHVPWLCTELVRLFGAPWVVRRMTGVLDGLTVGAVPAVLGYAIAGASTAWPRLALALVAGLGYGWMGGVDARAWKREDVVADAISGAPLRKWLGSQRRRAALLEGVPSGAVVVTSMGRAPEVAGVCDCYPLAFLPEHGKHGMRDMPQRRMAQRAILDPRTPLEERLALMRRFHTRHIHLGRTAKSKKLEKVLADVIVDKQRSQAGLLWTLDTTPGAHLRERDSQTE